MVYLVLIVGLIALDQISKMLVVNYVRPIDTLPVIDKFFHLTYVENRGAAFGFFKDNQMIFVIIAIIATLLGLYYLLIKKQSAFFSVIISLIVAGAIGNMIDRVRIGYVIDFLDFRFIWQYVFNVADSYLVVGTILLCVYILFVDGKAKQNETK
ncbi:MAG: signal peptidase II [Clostridioides sp.]|nr:signal peptidase II [Clostridioides sp.]